MRGMPCAHMFPRQSYANIARLKCYIDVPTNCIIEYSSWKLFCFAALPNADNSHLPIILIPKYNSVSVAYFHLKEEYEGLTENKEGGQTLCVPASACTERDIGYFKMTAVRAGMVATQSMDHVPGSVIQEKQRLTSTVIFSESLGPESLYMHVPKNIISNVAHLWSYNDAPTNIITTFILAEVILLWNTIQR